MTRYYPGNSLRKTLERLYELPLLRAAEQLQTHPNTLYARFQKIQDITRLDAKFL